MPNSFRNRRTVLTVENGMRPPYSQNWNFSIQRAFGRRLPGGCPVHREQGNAPSANDREPIRRSIGRAPRQGDADQRRLYAGLPWRAGVLAILRPSGW